MSFCYLKNLMLETWRNKTNTDTILWYFILGKQRQANTYAEERKCRQTHVQHVFVLEISADKIWKVKLMAGIEHEMLKLCSYFNNKASTYQTSLSTLKKFMHNFAA